MITHVSTHKHHYLSALIVAVMSYCAFCPQAEAGFDDIELTFGASIAQSVDDQVTAASNAPTLRLHVGYEGKPYYLWGSYETATSRMLGQPVAETAVLGAGLGLRYDINDKIFIFGEVGAAFMTHDIKEFVQQEIVYTDLVKTHAQGHRPPPVDPSKGNGQPYDQSYYSTLWDVEPKFIGRIGGGYKITPSLSATFAYRPLFAEETLELWDQEQRDAGLGWWQETRGKDYSTLEVGIEYVW